MKAIALLGGPTNLWPQKFKEKLAWAQKNNELIIGVDRGALYLEKLGIIPDVAIGDFDSLRKQDLSRVEQKVKDIRYSNPVKDLTDSELMLCVAFEDYQVDELVIFGATGGRIDHFLINLLMMLSPEMRPYIEKVIIIDQQNLIQFFDVGIHTLYKKDEYPYIGFATLTAVDDFNIIGALYELKNYSGTYPKVFSSNEFLPNSNQFKITSKKGIIVAIYSKDINRFQNLE